TSTIIRATYPPGRSGHISSGEERPTGTATRASPPGTQRTRPPRDSAVREPSAVRPALVIPASARKGVARDRRIRRRDHRRISTRPARTRYTRSGGRVHPVAHPGG